VLGLWFAFLSRQCGGKLGWSENEQESVEVHVSYKNKFEIDVVMNNTSHLVLEAYQSILLPVFYMSMYGLVRAWQNRLHTDGALCATFFSVKAARF
jgi:hypothetical protein